MRFTFRLLVTTLAISIAQFVAGGVAFSLFGEAALPPVVEGTMPWQLAANVMAAAVLVWIGARCTSGGWKTAAVLALLYFGIMHFNSLIEAAFFGFIGSEQLGTLLAMTAALAVLLGAMLTPLFGGEVHQVRPRAHLTPWRAVAGSFAYLVTYFTAGIAVYPFISHFYDLRNAPSGPAVIAMQLLVRGPIFVGLAALLLRTTRAGRGESILMTATAFSVIGGAAPLLVPNALMPDSIRWPHFVEVVTSNFAFGAFLGWLFTRAAVGVRRSSFPVARPS